MNTSTVIPNDDPFFTYKTSLGAAAWFKWYGLGLNFENSFLNCGLLLTSPKEF